VDGVDISFYAHENRLVQNKLASSITFHHRFVQTGNDYELSLVGLALDLRPGWLTIVLQCCDTVGWVIWPVKSSPRWPILCRVGHETLSVVLYGCVWASFIIVPSGLRLPEGRYLVNCVSAAPGSIWEIGVWWLHGTAAYDTSVFVHSMI